MFVSYARRFSWSLSVFLTCLPTVTFGSDFSFREVLSVSTGSRSDNIGNQFGGGKGVVLEPFNGFVIDSKNNIVISDSVNSKIMRFSIGGALLQPFFSDNASFSPQDLCLGKDDMLFALDPNHKRIVVFSSNGRLVNSYSPATAIRDKGKDIALLALSCNTAGVTVTFGIEGVRDIHPIYQDRYDQDFKLIERKTFEDEAAYYRAARESGRERGNFPEDQYGNRYRHPLVKDWYGKFLPLEKYDSRDVLVGTIDGRSLSKQTKYRVYDYYTMNKTKGLGQMKGDDFLIVNWYVTSGTIYVLLANNDYVKVLKTTGSAVDRGIGKEGGSP